MNRNIEPQLKTKEARTLYGVLACLTSPREIELFLRDLLTYEEIEEAVRRFQAAQMLDKKIPFRQISKKTKMSAATITRVNYWLHHGTGGYRCALRKLSQT